MVTISQLDMHQIFITLKKKIMGYQIIIVMYIPIPRLIPIISREKD